LEEIKGEKISKILLMSKGLPLPILPRREALKKSGRVIFLAQFVETTTLLTSSHGRMRSID
jgi:hypothetical protein